MKQVFLSGKGQIELFDVPVPGRLNGSILVRNSHSLISAGTEGAAITSKDGVNGLYEKFMNSRDRFGQVWEMVQKQGFAETASLIQNKLNDYTPLGYSSAGMVVEVDSDNLGFSAGQRVACMGAGFANHAEYVVVPKHLITPLPASVGYEQAAFASIACIAMQGIRRLELSPGERIAIVGLGLIGQIALKLATAMGYEVYGVDVDDQRVRHAKENCSAIEVINSSLDNSISVIQKCTGSRGVDGVVICASTKIDSLINDAFEMCRQRGRVSVVGDIGLGLERAKMYAKELEVRLSCSYGLGRYDADYELLGRDYPLPFARWTEQRNLEYFVRLLEGGKIDLSDLISATVDVQNAKNAYAKIKSKDSNVFGVLLDYKLPETRRLNRADYTLEFEGSRVSTNRLRMGFVGVGAYAKNVHLPNVRKIKNAEIFAVASRSGGSASVAAKKFGCAYATSDASEIIQDPNVDALVVSTRHSSHAGFVLAGLKARKHVFVEKPLALTTSDCLDIVREQKLARKLVRVGFNRRFSPMLKKMKNAIGQGQKLFNVRVNVGPVTEHWSNTEQEGGRLLGEGVHFFDLANWVMDGEPETVSCHFLGSASETNPNASITISYSCGSVANISYSTIGSTAQGKEYFELSGNSRGVAVDDYKKIQSYGCNARLDRKDRNNKGQLNAMLDFILTAEGRRHSDGADVMAGLLATAIYEASLASARQGALINLNDYIDGLQVND